MTEIKENCNVAAPFDISSFAPPQRIVFFDIETTGLKAGASSLYLIGALSFEAEGWRLTQYFANSPAEEKEVLEAFSAFLRQKLSGEVHLILVSFNGDGFDIPYLKALAVQYHMPDPFYGCVSFDLYKAVKPLKKLTGLPDCKLKTVERELCGIDREDPYSGGELIYVYEEYVRLTHILPGGCEDTANNHMLRQKLFDCLVLHNAEDIRDMLPLLQITAYRALLDGEFSLREAKLQEGPEEKKALDLKFTLKKPLPKELFLEEEGRMTLSVSGEDPLLFELVLPLEQRRLRYFYPDYRDYYYLPEEDEAIHKSLGVYVDRTRRRQATAQTCYTWKEGVFFPLPGESAAPGPCFYPCRRGTAYALYEEKLLSDETKLKNLALAALEHFRASKPPKKS